MNQKILLVEDDELSRRMMGLLLSSEGYDFDTASNGVEAVEAVKKQEYDFVLMDLQMPLMNGYDATRNIRSWEMEMGNNRIPIVALTAMLFEEEARQCLNAGMNDCIMKPFNTQELFKLIETYVGNTTLLSKQQSRTVVRRAVDKKLLDIQGALPRFGNDIQQYQELLEEFLDTLPDKIVQLLNSFRSRDYLALSDVAHNLKGVSASLGAMQLSALALQLDRQSRVGDSEQIEETLKEIEGMFNVLQDTAMELLSKFTG